MLSKALELAAKAHAGQLDKGGNPYIMHPLRILINHCADESNDVKICAVLHDAVEDSPLTLDDLRNEGFSQEIVAAIDCLSRREGENYDDYISRILTNLLACTVKRGDLADNMDLTRIPNPTAKDEKRLKKYQKAAARVDGAIRQAIYRTDI